MARCYSMHVCSLCAQVSACAITLLVGVALVTRSYFLSTAEQVIQAIRRDPSFAPESDLKEKDPAEDEMASARRFMMSVGTIILVISALLFINILCLLTLMCGPDSTYVQKVPFALRARQSMEKEVSNQIGYRVQFQSLLLFFFQILKFKSDEDIVTASNKGTRMTRMAHQKSSEALARKIAAGDAGQVRSGDKMRAIKLENKALRKRKGLAPSSTVTSDLSINSTMTSVSFTDNMGEKEVLPRESRASNSVLNDNSRFQNEKQARDQSAKNIPPERPSRKSLTQFDEYPQRSPETNQDDSVPTKDSKDNLNIIPTKVQGNLESTTSPKDRKASLGEGTLDRDKSPLDNKREVRESKADQEILPFHSNAMNSEDQSHQRISLAIRKAHASPTKSGESDRKAIDEIGTMEVKPEGFSSKKKIALLLGKPGTPLKAHEKET